MVIFACYFFTMNKSAEAYFITGCMRCSLGNTSACKVLQWEEPLRLLRKILLECGLTEQAKWGVPTYSFNHKNLFLISAFKSFCVLSFFNGSSLSDIENLLVKPGVNTQTGRWIKFTTAKQVAENISTIKAYIYESIDLEKSGSIKKVESTLPEIPKELEIQFLKDRNFLKAFQSLTPGRQRGYLIFFAQPKQSRTRTARIEKYREKIFAGIGFHNR